VKNQFDMVEENMNMTCLDLFKLDDKAALVTGGGSGLGKAMSVALAEAGARVAVCDLNLETAQQTASVISEGGGEAFALKVDVTDADQLEDMVDGVVQRFGRLDIAVNNAGMSGGGVPVEELEVDHWNRLTATNLSSVFLCAQAEGRFMIKHGGGSIINMASMSGFIVNRSLPVTAYCTSKGGVVMMTKGLASEWAKYAIRVNAIGPGYFKTPLTQKLWNTPETAEEIDNLIPMGRMGEPEELAGAVVFLASDASRYMTGHVLIIDGGYTIW
jgi:NAD(P)-dependent dehydrogenase (short-subunit alcohol dehydrogenase family)